MGVSVLLGLLALCSVMLGSESLLSDGRPELHIAGLFHRDEEQEMIAFRAAMERINMDKFVLPDVQLVPVIEVYSSADSFAMSKRVCNITAQGIAAIFGPSSKEMVNIVSSISETLEIPHILTHAFALRQPTKYQINIAPDTKSISQALVDLLNDMAWKTFTIIYDDDEGLFRLQEVLKAHGPSDSPVTVRKLREGEDHRPLLKEIHNSTETRILLDISNDKIIELLRQARQVKMLSDYSSYVVTSLDAHTLDYSEINSWNTEESSIANITGLRLLDPKSQEVQNAVQDWIFSERLNHGNILTLSPEEVKTSAALIYDAVYMFARSLHILNETRPFISERELSCDAAYQWEHGERIVSYIKAKYSSSDNNDVGMTGQLSLDPEADYRRTNFTLTLIQTNTDNAAGIWNMSGIHLFRSVEELEQSTKEALSKKLIMVVSRIGPPYLMKKENWTEDMGLGNEGLEGYCKDLIDEIAKILNFRYEFYLVKDGAYGKLLPDKTWNGLIRDLLDRKADLGICDLTITYDREAAVDFTMPFMNLGISILYKKPAQKPHNLYTFLKPLNTKVWLYMATAYVGVSLLLFMLARTTPMEWDNPHPCNQDPEELENTFDVLNSMWFSMGSLLQQGCDFLPKVTPNEWTNPAPNDPNSNVLEYALGLGNAIWHNVGSLMQQGSDIAPQAISTRMLASLWWFFTMIMISSYTANLAAFLTSELKENPISSAKDLAGQHKIQYGCVNDGSTKSFFQNSNVSLYQRMWSTMEGQKPTVFTKNNMDGVRRVRGKSADYAFIMESTGIEYEVERDCNLMQVGGLLDSKGYGIAMPKNSPYRTLISGAVLKLQESGKLLKLKNLWWKEKRGGGKCESEGTVSDADSNKLGMGAVGGVFLVLIWGCAAALFVAVMEFLWNTRQVAIENKITPKEAFIRELRFAVQCRGTTKPVKPRTPTPSSSSSASSCRSRSRSIVRSLGRSLIQLDNFQRLVGGGGDKGT